jgi:hypothetical protein
MARDNAVAFRRVGDLKRALRRLPIAVAQGVATRAAPDLTDRTRTAFSSGQTVYGAPRPRGVSGAALSLEATGTVKGELRFVRIGTIVRARLGPRYARYLIGRYDVLPNGPIPAAWRTALSALARAAVKGELP